MYVLAGGVALALIVGVGKRFFGATDSGIRMDERLISVQSAVGEIKTLVGALGGNVENLKGQVSGLTQGFVPRDEFRHAIGQIESRLDRIERSQK